MAELLKSLPFTVSILVRSNSQVSLYWLVFPHVLARQRVTTRLLRKPSLSTASTTRLNQKLSTLSYGSPTFWDSDFTNRCGGLVRWSVKAASASQHPALNAQTPLQTKTEWTQKEKPKKSDIVLNTFVSILGQSQIIAVLSRARICLLKGKTTPAPQPSLLWEAVRGMLGSTSICSQLPYFWKNTFSCVNSHTVKVLQNRK